MGGSGGRVDPLAAWVFAALVLACFAAFAITQHLKHTPTVVQDFKMTPFFFPHAAGPRRLEHMSFRIANSDEVTVTVLNSAGEEVVTLLRDRPLARYTQLSFEWDGHRGPTSAPAPASGTPHDPLLPVAYGPLAAAGEYHLRVSLRRQNRQVLSPRSFTLSLAVPKVAG
jgi:hypothetical protein